MAATGKGLAFGAGPQVVGALRPAALQRRLRSMPVGAGANRKCCTVQHPIARCVGGAAHTASKGPAWCTRKGTLHVAKRALPFLSMARLSRCGNPPMSAALACLFSFSARTDPFRRSPRGYQRGVVRYNRLSTALSEWEPSAPTQFGFAQALAVQSKVVSGPSDHMAAASQGTTCHNFLMVKIMSAYLGCH